MSEKSALCAALALNLAMVVLEIIGAAMSWRQLGVWMFQFYTQDSNLLALAACALLAAFQLRALRTGAEIPLWAQRLKYAAVCCLSVTFLVVVLVLAPMTGGAYGMLLFESTMLYHHLLCPLAAFFGFMLFEKQPALRRIDALLPAGLTFLYAAVLTALNIARVVDGPYPFLRVYAQSVPMSVLWALVMLGGTETLSWGLYALHGRRARKNG